MTELVSNVFILARMTRKNRLAVAVTTKLAKLQCIALAIPTKPRGLATSVLPVLGSARMTNTMTVARVAAITLPATAQKRSVTAIRVKRARAAAMSATPENPAPGSARIILTLRHQTATI